MKTLIALTIGLISLGAYAETPYEQLQRLYTTATVPAQYSDFPSAEENTSMKCSFAGADFKEALDTQGDIPRRYQYKSMGPEFPGKAVATIVHYSIFGVNLEATIRDTVMTVTETDLISTLEAAPIEYRNISSFDMTPFRLSFRKTSKGSIVAKIDYKYSKPDTFDRYIYCWK